MDTINIQPSFQFRGARNGRLMIELWDKEQWRDRNCSNHKTKQQFVYGNAPKCKARSGNGAHYCSQSKQRWALL
jgi:hypothetical protein